ncbi:MAG: T9SS type A sorting domain-containing protein [Candidatus Electryonea clarkiae]|nr:T9SS type A sorting domain-containing protein [Candidatus Electryonea clarkiae]
MKRHCLLGMMSLLLSICSSTILAQDSSLVVYHDGLTSVFFLSDNPKIIYEDDSNVLSITSLAEENDFQLDDIEKMTIELIENATPEVSNETLPSEFKVLQAYPNPFNARVTVPVMLPEKGIVEIVISNIMGQKIARISKSLEAGSQILTFELTNESGMSVTSGIYFLQIAFKDQAFTSKLVLLK